jgi:hypothetical protein
MERIYRKVILARKPVKGFVKESPPRFFEPRSHGMLIEL